MSLASRAHATLAAFGETIGLDGLALDQRGLAILQLGEVLVNVELDEDRQFLLLTAALGRPRGDLGEAYAHLLDANFCWQGTYGGTFSVERETGQVVLQRPLPLSSLELASFETALEEFVETSEAWSAQLAAGTTKAPSDALRFDLPGLIRA